jgi:DNA-binding NarL/FixJ family response regulator
MDEKLTRGPAGRLLQRAAEVDRLGKQGKSVREIAALLNVSQRTVRRDRVLLKS